MSIAGSLKIVLLSMWFGAALFFSAVVAPAAFGVLRSFAVQNANEIAGAIVNRSLSLVNISGFVVGLILLATLLFQRGSAGRVMFLIQCVCIAVVTLGTGVGHWVIAARMRALRSAMKVPIDLVASDDPNRLAFNSLHGYSVNALGLAMIAALAAIVLMTRDLKD
jgi:Domain of unknown function (DUF4149)